MTPRLLAIALFLVGCAGAQARDARDPASACADEDSTPKINACLQKALDARDAVLAAQVQRLGATWRERDGPDGGMFKVAPALEKSQQAWEAYREQECAARALTYGYGTGAAAESLRCMIELTAQRTDAIARHWRQAPAPASPIKLPP